ncbi:TolB-like translocation protein [Mycolicibacterium vinylchloridicum]|uniref:hypothetical protein n=1 Tax=Mycolicibacterium vinylchloridicum TaxID=2736928 RepID=UPI0015CE79C5|nr:hypothetical protein [Mycolicibacterium vinylchloridicum]
MNSGHLVGYVGGLAVALGVGTAIWLGTPTASADTGSPSVHSASSGTAKSARAPQRPKTSIKIAPAGKRKTPAAASSATPFTTETIDVGNGHNLLVETTSNGSISYTTRLSVQDNSTGAQLGSTVTLRGTKSASFITDSAKRVMVTTEVYDPGQPYATEVAVIDTATGIQLGTTLALVGRPSSQVEVGDGKHVLIATEIYTLTGDSTHVSLIDGATGTQTGTTLVLDGRSSRGPLVDATGDHAVIATSQDTTSSGYRTQFAVLDTRTGIQTGTTLSIDGHAAIQLLGGGHTLVSTFRYDASTGGATRFAVVDDATGSIVGTPFSLEGGSPWNTTPLRIDDTNLLVLTQTSGSASPSLRAAVLNTTAGTQTGHTVTIDGSLAGEPIVTADGMHVVLTATGGGETKIAVIDAAGGEQAGATVTLEGAARATMLAADGVHVVASSSDGAKTHIVVVDATTGEPTGTTLDLNGWTGAPLLNADGIHAVYVTTGGATTEIAVLDTTTGEQAGTTLSLDGVLGYTFVDAEKTHILITTTEGAATHFASVDSATGQLAGAPLTIAGQVLWPWPSTATDGTHALFVLLIPDALHLMLIDITTGAQTGSGVTVPGHEIGVPTVTDDGAHATIVTKVDATSSHGSSTHLVVIDTTTGNQVGVTTRMTGGPIAVGQLSADGKHIVVSTSAGIRATLDTTTGTAAVSTVRAPWGVDVEALALTPIGRFVSALQAVPFAIGVGMIWAFFGGLLALGSIYTQLEHVFGAKSTTLV